MEFLRAVNRDAHEPAVVVQETAPFVVEQGAVCLQAILNSAASGIALLELHGFTVEVERAEHGLTSVPYKLDIWHSLGFDV